MLPPSFHLEIDCNYNIVHYSILAPLFCKFIWHRIYFSRLANCCVHYATRSLPPSKSISSKSPTTNPLMYCTMHLWEYEIKISTYNIWVLLIWLLMIIQCCVVANFTHPRLKSNHQQSTPKQQILFLVVHYKFQNC